MTRLLTCVLFFVGAQSAWGQPAQQKFREDESNSPKFTITRDHNYIYVKRPKTLFFDQQDQEAFARIDGFIREELGKFANPMIQDPDGDLRALGASLDKFGRDVNDLLEVAGRLYNEVKRDGWNQGDPTGILVFGGAEFDYSFLKFVKAGGSLMVGLVLVPFEVHKYRLDTREYAGVETRWDTSWVAIPTVNIGAGASNTDPYTPRGGVGLVWGSLNKASELVGMTVGPSTTLQMGKGVNVKLLALKNFKKQKAINNTILMVGVEPGSSGQSSNVRFGKFAAEVHFNVSGIVDLLSLVSPIVNWQSVPTAENP